MNAFHGTDIAAEVEAATPLENVHPLKHIWAAHVTPTDETTELAWSDRESGEAVVGIDGTTEAAFEQYVGNSILESELDYVIEKHEKATKQTSTGILGLIPGAGPILSNAVSWAWTPKASVTTATGDTAHISQYYFSLPVEALSANAESKINNETSLDFRGIYIDWFAGENEFYSAGAVYPENREHLNERLPEAFDSGWLDDGITVDLDTSKTFESEIIELLTKIK